MANTIDITTTQNVTIEYDLAPLRERALALLLDLAILGFGYYLFVLLVVWAAGSDLEAEFGWLMLLILLPYAFFFLYNVLFEILNVGQTPGKMAMGVKVVRLDGKDPEWSDVLLRAVLHLVDTLFSAGIIGALLIKTSGKNQRLGDMAAHTTVIRIQGSRFQFRLQDILNIASLENYTPQYPQVRKLSERDMILIKTVLTRLQQYPNQAHEEVLEDLVSHLMPILEIEQRPANRVEFVKTLLRDYIVLTR